MPRRSCIVTSAGLTAALIVLTGCGDDGSESGASGSGSSASGSECDSLRVAEIIVGNYPQEQREWQQETARKFEEATGATLQYETMASAADEQTLIQTSVVSNRGPDVFTMGTTFVPVAYATGAFEILTEEDWEAVGGRDRFFEQQLGMSGPSEEEQIAVPFVMRPFGMVYNTEMFEQAGIDGPPETWDEFLDIATRTTNPEEGVYGTAVAYSSGFDPWKFIWMWTLQNGGQLVSEDLTTAELDSEEVLNAVTQYFDLLGANEALDPRSVSWDSPQVQAAFAQGELAMAPMTTPTWVPGLETGAVAGKYAFAPHPLVPFGEDSLPEGGAPAGTIISGDSMAIASYSDCKDLALQYIEFVTSEAEQTNYYDIFGSIPANEAAATSLAGDNPAVAAFVEATETALPTSFTGAWGNVQLGLTNVVTQTLPSLADGTYDVEAVRALLQEADATVQRDLDRQQADQ